MTGRREDVEYEPLTPSLALEGLELSDLKTLSDLANFDRELLSQSHEP